MANNVKTSWCPYCLQTKPSTTPATPSTRDVFDAEIERIDRLVSSLLLERSRLYRKWNEMQSPIYSLPPEILSLIFKFACPSLDFLQTYGIDTPPFDNLPHPRIISVLAAVSVHWHSVVLSTPSLWTSFIADDRDINAMWAIFARSGNLPVVANLEFPVDSLLRDSHAIVLAPILQDYASRIRMLHVRHALPNWLQEYIPSFVDLEILCLGKVSAITDEPVVIDGSYTRLVLKHCSRCIPSPPWSQVEVLHLDNIPIYECLELLEKGTLLREYRVRNPCCSSLEGRQLPSSSFILPRLELFEWVVDIDDPVDRAMLQNIRMPALRTLVWHENDALLRPPDSLLAFFEHLPSTLSALHVHNDAIYSCFSMFPYLLNLSSVENLILIDCDDSFVDGVFSGLGSQTCLVGKQEMPVLPKLQSIYIDNCIGPDQTKVLKLFQRGPPESQPGSLFRLEFAECQVDWTPEFKEELIRMVEKGYKVELWEDSIPVDWLPRVKLPQK